MSTVKAVWTIKLDVTCPRCEHYFDITDESDFWEFAGIKQAGEEREGYETECPACSHEFKCDFVY